VHILLVILANLIAFALRFDGRVPDWAYAVQIQMLLPLVLIRATIFAPFGLYRGLWRYAGIWDLVHLMAGILVSSAVFYAAALTLLQGPTYPRSVLVIDALVLTFLIGGLRMGVRLYRQRGRMRAPRRGTRKSVLIYGAGEAGELIVRDLKNNAFFDYSPVGFIDDDRDKVGEWIHDVPVLGTRADLPRIMAERRPDEVLIAMPSVAASTIRSVFRALEPFKVRVTVVPNLRDILNGTAAVSQIRRLAIEDLLPRAPVDLDHGQLRHLLAGRRVLVTGAGGSIGSELCRQMASMRPEALVLYDRNENGLYTLAGALADEGFAAGVHPVLGDITDVDRLDCTMTQFRPEIIFHAAAHKHVPLMESHPCEAVKNNVLGTQAVADAAERHRVARFILISTDKAVNPTSVMGTTKRIAELLVRSRVDAVTSFLTVRFGNVMGSNGSAIPRFLEQIRRGGPVTVTDPHIRRYFMLVPEAAQLVLHVACIGRRGGVYVLEMGEQIKMVEIARNLIRLAGFVPDEDIKITFIGLRPGEKLFEELVGRGETAAPCEVGKVLEVTSQDLPSAAWLEARIDELVSFARVGKATDVMRVMSTIVPEFTGRPWEMPRPASPRRSDQKRPVLIPRTLGRAASAGS
jgi:FlaA1/EpsC-like NDP-sugar epimerase